IELGEWEGTDLLCFAFSVAVLAALHRQHNRRIRLLLHPCFNLGSFKAKHPIHAKEGNRVLTLALSTSLTPPANGATVNTRQCCHICRRHPTLTGISVREAYVHSLRIIVLRHYCERDTPIKKLLGSLPKIPVVQKFN